VAGQTLTSKITSRGQPSTSNRTWQTHIFSMVHKINSLKYSAVQSKAQLLQQSKWCLGQIPLTTSVRQKSMRQLTVAIRYSPSKAMLLLTETRMQCPGTNHQSAAKEPTSNWSRSLTCKVLSKSLMEVSTASSENCLPKLWEFTTSSCLRLKISSKVAWHSPSKTKRSPRVRLQGRQQSYSKWWLAKMVWPIPTVAVWCNLLPQLTDC